MSKLSTKISTKISLSSLILVAIIIFYLITRLWSLGSIPQTLNPDEASIGYNSFLLLQSGKDEWQQSWPLVLEAFGDQKIIGYSFLVIASMLVLPIGDLAVRFPVFISGLLIILLTDYLLKKWRFQTTDRLITLAILVTQPVFFWYTKVGFEATASLVFILILIIILFTDISERRLALASALASASTIFSILLYNSPLIIIPGLLLTAFIIQATSSLNNYSFLNTHKTKKTQFFILAVIFISWLVMFVTLQNLTSQKSQITIFGDPTIQSNFATYRQEFHNNYIDNNTLKLIFANKYIYYTAQMIQNASLQLHPGFLLKNSPGHLWHALPQTGYIFLPTLIFAFLGILFSIKNMLDKKQRWILTLLLITAISILPVAISTNAPHATRSLLFFWSIIIFSGAGLGKFFDLSYQLLQKIEIKIMTLIYLAIFLVFSIYACQYLKLFFIDYPHNLQAQAIWHSGFEHIIQSTEQKYPQEIKVAIIDPRGFHYILTAWYLKMPAEYFHNTKVKQLPDNINFKYGEKVGRYRFIKDKNDVIDEKIIIFWDQNQNEWLLEKI